MEVRFVKAGVLTRCLIAGDPGAYPILMLHGYGGTADVWLRNVDALGKDYFVVAVDMLGSGFTRPEKISDGPPQPATVGHLRRLVDELNFDRFCAMGTSYGSGIAALTYFAMPSRVDRLVLNGSGSCFHTEEELAASLNKVMQNFRAVMEAPTVEACRKAVQNQVFVKSAVPEEMLLTMATAYAQPWMKAAWEAGLRGLIDVGARPHQIRNRLEQIAVETLVIWGRQDPGASYEAGRAGTLRMPKAKFVTFEDCGHKPMFEYPQKYNELVRGFLNERAADVR